MEQKNLKTSVFSSENVFCDSFELPIDVDFTLPDYYSDISKILKCRAVSRISSKTINGNHISIEGCVTVTVIYCGSDKCVSSYEYQYPFSKSFDTGVNTDGCILSAKSRCEYINCRAVTGRKIDLHGAAGIYITLTRRRMTEVISECDDCNIELLRGSIPATVPMGCADKYLLLEEEIELGSGQPDIRCVIRYDANAVITDSKIMVGKSVVSGEMTVKILYAPEDSSSLQTVRYQLPFSQLIELEGVSDGCDCESKVSVVHLEVKPRVSASGECRQLMLTAKLLVTSECCCNNDVAVILDAYSRKYEASITKNEVCFNKICENINQTFSCKKNIEFPKGALSEIYDMWSESRIDSVKFNDNKMVVCGVVTAFIIALDGEDMPTFYEKTIDFEFAHPLGIDGELSCTPEITVTSVNFTLLSDSDIEIRAELNISAAVYKRSDIPLITEIKIDNTKTIVKPSQSAMIIYFASSGEKIWDIARKYFADANEIKQINDICDDILRADKMILIPTT